MRRLRRLRSIPWPERRLALTALLLLAAVRLALSTLPFQRVRRAVDHLSQPGAGSASSEQPSPEKIASYVAATARYVPSASCLTQALAAQVLLGRAGHRCELRIGVAREAGRLEAHAWVEHAGRIVIGGPASHVARYTPLSRPQEYT